MSSRLFLFITPDGVTYSSEERTSPDVDNFQVLGWAEGENEEEAFRSFIRSNKWIFDTDFEEVICIEIKTKIHKGKRFIL